MNRNQITTARSDTVLIFVAASFGKAWPLFEEEQIHPARFNNGGGFSTFTGYIDFSPKLSSIGRNVLGQILILVLCTWGC
jgi:hypothetical protein